MSETTTNTTAIPNHLQVILRLRPAEGPCAFAVSSDGAGIAARDSPSDPIVHCTKAYGPTATNANVFADIVRPTLDEFLLGKTCCLMAYGQTGSGKTHTMFGWQGTEAGLVEQSVKYIFERCNKAKRATRYRVGVSFVEVYCERVRDLLTSDSGASADLPLRESQSGACFVPSATLRICHDAATVMQVLDVGTSNKTIGCSYVHNKSSRSHTIFTVTVASERNVSGEAPSVKMSRYMFVDLAGSELLVDGFGAEQQGETKTINLSLLALRGVIDSLANKAPFIPYRNSVLTRLLGQALSPSGSTVAICTCSPLAEHSAMTAGTLRFADVAGRVEQQAKIHEFLRAQSVGAKVGVAVEVSVKMTKNVGKSTTTATSVPVPVELTCVTTKHDVRAPNLGGASLVVHVTQRQSGEKTNRLAFFLHAFGGGCNGRDFAFFDDALVSAGYTVIGPDFPGFGLSPGKRQASRTDRLWDSDGVLTTLEAVMEWAIQRFTTSGTKKGLQLLVLGYDWGGNMALSLAVHPQWKRHLVGLVLHHPSWTDPPAVLSAAAKLPVLMLWIPNDQLHLISHGRKLAAAIGKSAQLVSMVPAEAGRNVTDAEWADSILRNALPWMTAQKLLTPVETPVQNQTQAAQSAVLPLVPPPGANTGGDSGDDEVDDGDLDSDDEDGSFSTQSSFLACLLADPIAAEDAIATREKELAAQRKSIAAAVRAAAVAAKQDAVLAKIAEGAPSAVGNLQLILSRSHAQFPSEVIFIDALLGRGAGRVLRSSLLSAVGTLPAIPPYCAPELFVQWGLWRDGPKGTAQLCPRYCSGRRVFVELTDLNTNFLSPDFGRVARGKTVSFNSKDGFLTSRAFVVGPSSGSDQHVQVTVEVTGGSETQTVNVPVAALDRWNAPTCFATTASPLTLTFEDAIRASYGTTLLKTKICECALSIAPLVGQMDFAAAVAERTSLNPQPSMPANTALLRLQKDAIVELRKRMNMIHHVQMGKDPNRLCVPDVGRLATYGQWHCHGMASVFAALLLPFATALGIAVKFRDGFYYSGRDDAASGWDGTPRRIADHTWLEVTLFPSGATYCCDPSFTDRGEPILIPLDEAYCASGRRYPYRDLTSRVPNQTLAVDAVPLHGTEAAACAATYFYNASVM